MKLLHGRLVVIGVVCLGFVSWGCSESAPEGPVGGETVKLSPGMEQMKEDMINKMKNKEYGKGLAKMPRPK